MAKKRVAKEATRMPLGVCIISILNYVVAFVLLLSGFVFLIANSIFSTSDDARMTALKFFEELTASTTIATKIVSSLAAFMVVGGIVAILLAALFFFMGRELWRGKNWARIVTIIFFGLGFVGALADLLRGDFAGNVIELIVDGLISGYLLFNKKVRAVFSR